jgi:hypothetical protein
MCCASQERPRPSTSITKASQFVLCRLQPVSFATTRRHVTLRQNCMFVDYGDSRILWRTDCTASRYFDGRIACLLITAAAGSSEGQTARRHVRGLAVFKVAVDTEYQIWSKYVYCFVIWHTDGQTVRSRRPLCCASTVRSLCKGRIKKCDLFIYVIFQSFACIS